MKRRLVRHGPSTLIVSLPAEWVRSKGLKEKDEVEVIPEKNQLIISTENKRIKESITINITNFDRTSLVLLLQAVYRAGFSKATLLFSIPETVHYRTKNKVLYSTVIHQIMGRFIGFEIVKEIEGKIEIAEVSYIDKEEIELMINRAFLLLNDMAGSFCEALQAGDSTKMATIENQHDSITKHISYLLRAISQGDSYFNKQATALHHIIATTDKITDIFKYISREQIKRKNPVHKLMNPLLLIITSSITEYSSFFRKYDEKLITKISYNRDLFKRQLKKIQPIISRQDYTIGIQLTPILELLYDLHEWRIHLHLITSSRDASERYGSAYYVPH